MLPDCLVGKDLRGVVPGQGFRKRDEGDQELEGVKGVLETGERRVCMQKTKAYLQDPKEVREATPLRGWDVAEEVTGLDQARTLTFILGFTGRRQ